MPSLATPAIQWSSMPRTASSCRGGAGISGGQPQFIEPLARAAVAAGIAGVFVEVHDAPERALSDGPNALRLDLLAPFWERLQALDALIKKWSIQR